MNIILIGFMGTGKSSAGRLLAKRLGMEFIESDSLIEKEQGRSISAIFEKEGEKHFRKLETDLLNKIMTKNNVVLSAGGGMVLLDENTTIMKKMGKVILLTAEPEVIFERVKHESFRPLLKVSDPLQEIKKLLKVRDPHYQKAADAVIETSHLTLEEVANKIVEYIK